MKIAYTALLLLLIGCQSSDNVKIETNEYQALDSVIQQSQKNFVTVSEANKRGDSSITKKVEKTVNQITTLKQEVKELKQENNALKTQLDIVTDSGKPFKLLPVSDN